MAHAFLSMRRRLVEILRHVVIQRGVVHPCLAQTLFKAQEQPYCLLHKKVSLVNWHAFDSDAVRDLVIVT